MNRNPTVAKVLKAARDKANMTQADAAEKLGYISAQFISNVERGVASLPVKKVEKIASIYKIPVRVIIDAKAKDLKHRLERAVKDGHSKRRVS